MKHDLDQPEVYCLRWAQRAVVFFAIVMIVILFHLYRRWSIDWWYVLIGAGAFVTLVPRVMLSFSGVRITIFGVPIMRSTPWHELVQIDLTPNHGWVCLTRRDGTYAWIPILMLDIKGLELVERMVERYQHHLNQVCRRCGYNLKGNTSGQCPECGQTVAVDVPKLVIKDRKVNPG